MYLSLPAVGFSAKVPQKQAGMRILPPMSLPTPRMEPLPPIMAPSPPEEPPEDLFVACGLRVLP